MYNTKSELSPKWNRISTDRSLPTVGILKTTQKRRSSTISLSNLFPRRKSLQTTVLQSRRQSLWMDLSKNPPTNEQQQQQSSTYPTLEHDYSSILRKKILRILLVFSYLLSISLLAIALATFYGLFWSGYSPTTSNQNNHNHNNNILYFKPTVRSLISLTTNSTFLN